MVNKKLWNIVGVLILIGIVSGLFKITTRTPVPVNNGEAFTIQSWHTTNGARVLYVPAPQLPMVDVQVVFDAGSARDGSLPGIASMTNAMLNEGAGEWSTNQLAERFDSIGALYGASASYDMAMISLRALTDKAILSKAVNTFATVLNQPRFPEAELERIRAQTLIGLENQLQSPESIASKAFYKALYGEHPYASPTSGTMASVKTIKREDIAAFYKKYYVAKNALVAIVGAVTREQAEQLAESIIAELPAGAAADNLPKVKAIEQAVRIKKKHPSTQTHILVGQPGVKRGDDDYFALYVGNHILGGSGFGSRIMSEIREKRGLAYSSYSYFMPQRGYGPFIMGLQTSNEQAKQALELLNEVLTTFIEDGPTKDELRHAKKNITGGFPLRIDSNKDIIGYIAMIGFYNLPLDYLHSFNDNIEAISVEDIRQAFQRRIDPQHMVTVTVGDGEFNHE